MTNFKSFYFDVWIILIANYNLTSGWSLSDYYLNCSAYSAATQNSTISRLSWSARLHACFEDNPYEITQLPLPFGFPYVVLEYDYNVIYVIGFEGNKISLMGQLVLVWIDFYRIWDTNQIPLDKIQLPLNKIWYPQVILCSSVTKRSIKLLEPDDLVVLFPTIVTLFRTNVIEGHCNVDYYRFPFDKQNCELEFEIDRYLFNQQDVYLNRLNYTFQFENFINEEWSLVNVVTLPINISFKELNVDSDGYSTNVVISETTNAKVGFKVNLTLQRYPQFYIVNILVPIIVLTIIGQTAFAIPEHADGKIIVPLTVLLGFMFVQGIVANELPRSQVAPSLNYYVLTCILLSSANTLCCAICLWIAHMTLRMPSWLHVAVIDLVGTCVFPSQWSILIYRGFRRGHSLSKNEKVSVTTSQLAGALSNLSEQCFTIPRASLAGEQHFSLLSFSNQFASSQMSEGLSDNSLVQNNLKESHNLNVSENNTDKEWVLVAKVVNRIFGLVHLAALLACFFVYILPLLVD